MSEFRELQAKLQKIEENYYKDLDIDIQELRIANTTLSPVELVSLARQRFGQDAATYLSNQLETEGDVKDYRKRNQTYFTENSEGQSTPELFDRDGYHLSVRKAEFMHSDILDKVVLHDLENISPDSGEPKIVTFDDGVLAKEIAKKFGGMLTRTKMGTYRIIPTNAMTEENLEEGGEELFVNDEQHAQITAILAKRDPKLTITGYGPGENNTINVLASTGDFDVNDPYDAGDRHLVFDPAYGDFIDDDGFNDWMEQNPFESIEEDWPQQEETYDDMVEYWKGSLSRSIVTKKVFTQLYRAANQNIEELNAAIEDQAHSIAEMYHGSGEGIGTSDQNHFVASIARQLGIDDVFGWNKKKDPIGEDLHSEDPISVQIKSLLAQRKKVMSKIGGAVGEIVGTEGRLIYIKIRGMATPAVTSFDSKDNVEIVGNIDHYDVIEHIDYPDDDLDEGKWDYKKGDKGKGQGVTSPMYDGGAENRKNRKAFRKAAKAKAHQARMRGEVDEEFELDEARGRVVEVPLELRGTDAGNAAGATSRDAERFLADLGPDDDVSHDVVDPETGELLDWPTKGLNRDEREDDEDAAYWRAYGGTKRERGQAKYKAQQERGAGYDDVPTLLLQKGNMFGDTINMAWEFLSDLRDSDFYNVVWRNVGEGFDDDEMRTAAQGDYDIDYDVPVALKRKDGVKLASDDHDNIKEIIKAVKAASTMQNVGIGFAGTTEDGTTARFYPSFM